MLNLGSIFLLTIKQKTFLHYCMHYIGSSLIKNKIIRKINMITDYQKKWNIIVKMQGKIKAVVSFDFLVLMYETKEFHEKG